MILRRYKKEEPQKEVEVKEEPKKVSGSDDNKPKQSKKQPTDKRKSS
jgi:hypothetical protein